MAISLKMLCNDLHRYAAVISVPKDMMPGCNAPNRGGWHVALSADGMKYVLTYTEKDMTDTLLVSDDADQILETLFDELTLNLGAQRNARETLEPNGASLSLITPASDEELHVMATEFQRKLGSAQEFLLNQINPVWAERQKLRNAERLADIAKRFGK